jgi:RHS repeat-associated protein
VPNNEQNTSSTSWYQQYDYDSLNRLLRVHEYTGNTSLDWQQEYVYDRWGNRTIAQGSTETYGTGIPKPNFTVNTDNNRLGVPSGQSGTMSYDAVGNLTTDTYSAAAVTRAYEAENRMTSETQASSYVAGSYSYDGGGKRVKRVVGSTETWQVYGLGGELIAEYAANTAASSPQKEYGYRNGQLLVTLTTALPGGAPSFHDNPIQVGVTTVQALHITELRTAINNLRVHLGMSSSYWTTSATTNDYINANPILEMRIALDQALGAPAGGYAAGLAQGQPVKAIHIQELRDRLTAASELDVRWLVTDQLGTPRMAFDQSGSLTTTSRHDYLPFGEELYDGTGSRTTTQGYSIGDGARQKFTGYERDSETDLDFAQARYDSSTQGRFTSPDPYSGSMNGANPQTFNRYAYVGNNPVNRTDSTSLDWTTDASQQGGSMYYQANCGELSRVLGASNKNHPVNFEGSIEPQYPQSEPEQEPQEEVTVIIVDTLEEVIEPQYSAAYEPFVVSNPDKLEKDIQAGKVQYLNEEGVAMCARLPMMWSNDQEH